MECTEGHDLAFDVLHVIFLIALLLQMRGKSCIDVCVIFSSVSIGFLGMVGDGDGGAGGEVR
jgi:hypothetical protein